MRIMSNGNPEKIKVTQFTFFKYEILKKGVYTKYLNSYIYLNS